MRQPVCEVARGDGHAGSGFDARGVSEFGVVVRRLAGGVEAGQRDRRVGVDTEFADDRDGVVRVEFEVRTGVRQPDGRHNVVVCDSVRGVGRADAEGDVECPERPSDDTRGCDGGTAPVDAETNERRLAQGRGGVGGGCLFGGAHGHSVTLRGVRQRRRSCR